MRQELAELLLGGKRIYYKRLTLRFMPLRWYFGIGVGKAGYFAVNVGPFQAFIDIGDKLIKWIG